ncbi:glycosyltransferase [Kiloniella litopenaei]|uniref:glycosyltransferase n=1 Tax=Kiloniella litopenaei TaxID=1549748 RepID=UPI003BAC7422
MTDHSPCITVYLVNYNYGRFLEQSIDSVLTQTFQDFELLIIDDGSTDESHEIIKRYENHPKVRTVLQQNKGLNATNNVALSMARGQYIMRLDADDFLEAHALQILSGVLNRKPGIGLVFPDYYEISEEGDILEIVRRYNFNEVTLMDQPAHGACTMIRVDALKELGGYDEEFRCQDGYDLWVRFIDHYRVENVNLPLFFYRQHSSSLTRNEPRLLGTRARIIEKKNQSTEQIQSMPVVIPVRGSAADSHSIALRKLTDRYVFQWSLDPALAAERISEVIITSPDDEVLDRAHELYGDRIRTVKRNLDMARLNTSPADAVKAALDTVYTQNGQPLPEAVMTLFVESPFRLPRHLDSAVDMMALFETDSVIAVRPELDTFYRHDGSGLHPLRNSTRLRLETEAVFREVGDLKVTKTSLLQENGSLVSGTVGHIVMDYQFSHSIITAWDWTTVELLAEQNVTGFTPEKEA